MGKAGNVTVPVQLPVIRGQCAGASNLLGAHPLISPSHLPTYFFNAPHKTEGASAARLTRHGQQLSLILAEAPAPFVLYGGRVTLLPLYQNLQTAIPVYYGDTFAICAGLGT